MTWLRDEKGRPSATLTMAVVTLAVVLVKTLVAGVVVGQVHLGSGLDGGTVAALRAPTLGSYVARRHTEARRPD